MRERTRINAMRSGLVVMGALAFGYLTLQLGFRPFVERAQQTLDQTAHRGNGDGETVSVAYPSEKEI